VFGSKKRRGGKGYTFGSCGERRNFEINLLFYP